MLVAAVNGNPTVNGNFVAFLFLYHSYPKYILYFKGFIYLGSSFNGRGNGRTVTNYFLSDELVSYPYPEYFMLFLFIEF